MQFSTKEIPFLLFFREILCYPNFHIPFFFSLLDSKGLDQMKVCLIKLHSYMKQPKNVSSELNIIMRYKTMHMSMESKKTTGSPCFA